MVSVHPVFDVETRTWFTNTGVEARSLCELQSKLPKARIVGYYPNGYHSTPIAKSRPVLTLPVTTTSANSVTGAFGQRVGTLQSAKPAKRPESEVEPELPELPPAEFKPLARYATPAQEELPLPRFLPSRPRLVPADASNNTIPKKEAPPLEAMFPPEPVAAAADHAEEHEPSEATFRMSGNGVVWSDKKIEQLRQLVEDGLTARQIACELNVTKNAVIGKTHRIGVQLKRNNGGRLRCWSM